MEDRDDRPMSASEDRSSARARWQFTLREMLIGVTVFCVLLGLASWKGVAWGIGGGIVISLCLVGAAIYARRKRRIICSVLCLVIALSVGGLHFFGPSSSVVSVCPIFGKEKTTETVLGATWRESVKDSDLSNWYGQMKLKPHTHQWLHLCSTRQRWGGEVICYDSFGFELAPLQFLKKVSENADAATFEELAQDYCDLGQDPIRTHKFVAKCLGILKTRLRRELLESDAVEPVMK